MKINNISEMIGGWFVGDFEESAYRTSDFEVAYKFHEKGEKWPTHYHEKLTEINFIIRGEMSVQEKILKDGDIFTLSPYEVADPVFLKDTEMIVVKTPSVPGDKVIVSSE